jgi:hypothetical protein
LKNFWNYINLNNTKATDSFLEASVTKQLLHPSFDLKKCRTEKLPTVCLKILNAFLKFNIPEINEQLLLRNREPVPEAMIFSESQTQSTERQNLSGQLQEGKYYQILKAQSLKLKGKGNFRHIMKLLTDLRDKLANQSTHGDSHFFSQVDDSDAVMISDRQGAPKPLQSARRNTIRLSEYIESIEFRKHLGKSQSEGAQMYQDMTMSEIVEDLEVNGRQSKLYFLFKLNDRILKDIETMQLEKRSRYSHVLKKRRSGFPENEMDNDDGLLSKQESSE